MSQLETEPHKDELKEPKLLIKKEKKVKALKQPKEPKEKKPRAYSFIQAFAEWRKEKNWTGLCPKKDTDEYKEIRKIYEAHVKTPSN